MGVYRLLKFCSENEDKLTSYVDIIDIAYDRFQQNGKSLVILVDYINFMFYLCGVMDELVENDIELGNLDPKYMHFGGQYDVVDRLLRSFILQFREKHIEFRFFVDGDAGSVREEQNWKRHIWIQAFNDYAQASAVLKQVFHGERRLNQVGGYFLPPLLDEQVQRVLRELKSEIIVCEGEADCWIAMELRDDPEIFAVFANDSDFLLMPKARVVLNDNFYTLPINSDMELSEINRFVVGLYDVENLMQFLDLPQAAFAELAILSGNDMTKPFIQKYPDLFEKLGISREINDISNFIMDLPNMRLEDSEVIKEILNKDEEFSSAVILARKFYSLEYVDERTELLKSGTDFENLIRGRVSEGKLPKISLAVINTGAMWRKGVLEDAAVGYAPCRHVLSPLRSIIYRILGCPLVTEYGKTPKEVLGETKVCSHFIFA